uniref:Uncharacterized protein n=1 Tax=Avena sativa TaxID=4498 RepID=A0ACD5ZJI1_AVESA
MAATSAVSPLAATVPVQAVLFDIDGTLCDSDPLHHVAFQEMLLAIGYNNGVPIDDEFFIKNIAGRSDVEAAQNLFPDCPLEKGLKFLEDKDTKYRRLGEASEQFLGKKLPRLESREVAEEKWRRH